MKSIKRIPVMLLVMIISFSVLVVGAQGLYVYSTVRDFGYMMPANYNFSKTLSTIYLYGNYDYINFSINSEDYGTYFFYEIYSDKDYTDLVNSDYTYCDGIGEYTYSPYVKLQGIYKTGTYYCVTYAADIESDGDIWISESSLRRFKVVVNRLPKYSQQVIGLNFVINTVDGPLVKWYALPSSVKYNIYRRPLVGTKWEKIGTVNGSTYEFTDKSVKNKNGRYVYTVRGVDKNGTLTRYHYSGVTAHYAKTPVVSSVSTVVDNRVQIKWNSTGSTAVYQIYRMENDGGWELLKKDHKGTVFYDETVRSGNKYRYTVRAVIKTYTGTALSHFYNGKTVTYIAAPELNPLKFTENGMNVTWQASEGAVKYAVYRKPLDENKNWRLIGKVDSKTTAFVDTTAVKEGNYLYTVRSEGANFQGSYLGKGVEYFNLVPPDFKVDVKDNKITLSWNKVPYAESYEVYGKFAGDDYGWHYLKNSKVCTYEIAPKTYTDVIFAVRSVRGNTKSAYKYSDNVTVFPFIEPNYVVYKDYIRLYWNSAGVDSYNIYRKLASDSDSEYELIANTVNSKYDDKTAQYDVMYEYSIRGVKNFVEQSTNLTSKIITKYSPEKYIQSFNVYRKKCIGYEYNSSDAIYFSKKTTPLAESMKQCIYTIHTDGWVNLGNRWYYDNPVFQYAGDAPTFSFVVCDDNGKTPIDSVMYVLDREMCAETYIDLNVNASSVNVSWNSVDNAKEFIFEEYENDIEEVVKTDGSEKYTVSIPLSKLKESTTLNFYLTAVHNNGNITVKNVRNIHVYKTFPTLNQVYSDETGNTIYWTFNGSMSDMWNEFHIFRKAPGEKYWYRLKYTSVLDSGDSQYLHFDRTAKPGVKYVYTVRVYDNRISSYVSYYDTKGLQVGQISTPKLYSATNTSSGIKVSWEYNYAAQGYYIYRKTAGTGWVKIGTVYRSDEVGAVYTDKTAKSGVTYYYTVRSFDDSVLSRYDSVGVKCKKS